MPSFLSGGLYDGFGCAFESSALRAFLKLGAEALAELEAQTAKDEVGDEIRLIDDRLYPSAVMPSVIGVPENKG